MVPASNARIEDITAQNRRAWNEIALVRGSRWEEKTPASSYAEGKTTLSEEVRAAAGDVRGRTLLHLQCATGEDTLSWAARGARVTGVDISEVQIDIARRKAVNAGLDAAFLAADVMALPADLGTFNVVVTGGGAMKWIPDVDRWASQVTAHVASGGSIIVEDEHPLASVLDVSQGEVRLVDGYLRRGKPRRRGPTWRHFDDHGVATQERYDFVWPLGDVVTALVGAGLRLRSLREYPVGADARWRFGPLVQELGGLPGRYLVVAEAAD